MMRRIVMVGTFPPPTHGMAVINDSMRSFLVQRGADVRAIDTAAPGLARDASRLRRLPRVAKGLFAFARHALSRNAIMYLGVAGGFGQLYDIFFVVLARTLRVPLCLHHHNFTYLDSPTFISYLLFRICGRNCTHVVLSLRMAEKLSESRVPIDRIVPLSNAAFLATGGNTSSRRSALRCVGFFSNISEEKGIFEFIALAQALLISAPQLRLIVAGPFQDDSVKRSVAPLLGELSNTTYIGPQYGSNKATLLESLDALIFPTRYANEAEPVTILESMKHATPVIAFGRGAIPEIMKGSGGTVIDLGASFPRVAESQILSWANDDAGYQRASGASRARFERLCDDASETLEALARDLFDDRHSPARISGSIPDMG